MRRSGGIVAAGLVLALAASGYVVADAYDVVPGVLTLAPEKAAVPDPAQPVPTGPLSAPSGAPGLPAAATPLAPATGGRAVTPEAVRRRLAGLVANPALGARGASASVQVLDAQTGQEVYALNPGTARTPASVAKLASAAAVTTTLPLDTRLRTTVVEGSRFGEIVLVAGGDSLLSPGYGDPSSAIGHAGLADLADDTASAVKAAGLSSVTLVLDDTYAKGPVGGPTWEPGFLSLGFTGPITMLGLSSQRATPYHPAPADPPVAAAEAFKKLLAARGVQAAATLSRAKAPAGARALATVESAPVRDILREALLSSDNALTEALARQAAARGGVTELSTGAVGAWVLRQVASLGIPTTGSTMADASGLGAGSRMPVTVLAGLLRLALDGRHPQLASAFAGLPVAGATGTLSTRFNLPGRNVAGRGYVRAKTGSLPEVSALAGTVSTADGRTLVYVAVVNSPANVLELRAALDDIGSALAECGCS